MKLLVEVRGYGLCYHHYIYDTKAPLSHTIGSQGDDGYHEPVPESSDDLKEGEQTEHITLTRRMCCWLDHLKLSWKMGWYLHVIGLQSLKKHKNAFWVFCCVLNCHSHICLSLLWQVCQLLSFLFWGDLAIVTHAVNTFRLDYCTSHNSC